MQVNVRILRITYARHHMYECDAYMWLNQTIAPCDSNTNKNNNNNKNTRSTVPFKITHKRNVCFRCARSVLVKGFSTTRMCISHFDNHHNHDNRSDRTVTQEYIVSTKVLSIDQRQLFALMRSADNSFSDFLIHPKHAQMCWWRAYSGRDFAIKVCLCACYVNNIAQFSPNNCRYMKLQSIYGIRNVDWSICVCWSTLFVRCKRGGWQIHSIQWVSMKGVLYYVGSARSYIGSDLGTFHTEDK